MKRFFTTLAVIGILVISCKKKDSAPPPTSPLVKTAAITNNGGGNITTGGSIVSDGGASVTKSGIAWSQGHATPSITDSVVESTTTSGAFTVNINGIDFGKTYYFRAYATNSVGTGYGDVVTLTTSNDSVRFTYNGQTVTYGIIISPTTGKKWLDRNLGATQVATAFNDYKAYGDLFQWGRPADGHQLINWTSSTTGTFVNGTSNSFATSDNPNTNNFIYVPWAQLTTFIDWRDDNNLNRWNTNPKGPCPEGWHVPTSNEWAAEVYYLDPSGSSTGGTATSGGIKDATTAYNLLKLTTSGFRKGTADDATANTLQHMDAGDYWSSTATFNAFDNAAINVNFGSGSAYMLQNYIWNDAGTPIRCIKNL